MLEAEFTCIGSRHSNDGIIEPLEAYLMTSVKWRPTGAPETKTPVTIYDTKQQLQHLERL